MQTAVVKLKPPQIETRQQFENRLVVLRVAYDFVDTEFADGYRAAIDDLQCIARECSFKEDKP